MDSFNIDDLNDDVLFSDVYLKFHNYLIQQEITKNSDVIYLNILRCLNNKLYVEKNKYKRKRIIIDNDTICCICNKKMQPDIIFKCEDGKIMHVYHDDDY